MIDPPLGATQPPAPGPASPPPTAGTTSRTGTDGPFAAVVVALSRSLSSLDGVLHSVQTVTYEGGTMGSRGPFVTEIWVDARHEVARSTDGGAHNSVVVSGVAYSWPTVMAQQRPIALLPCFGVPAVVTTVVPCPDTSVVVDGFRTETGTLDGRAVVTLVSHERPEPQDVTVRRSFDATTMFPVATLVEGTANGQPYRAATTIVNDVVAAGSLPDGFFTPAAIGFVATDVTSLFDGVPPTPPIYWLGPAYAGGDGIPGLVLASVDTSAIGITLVYALASDPYGAYSPLSVSSVDHQTALDIQEGVPVCPGTGAWMIGDAEATLRCPADGTATMPHVTARLVAPDAVVRIDAPARCVQRACTNGPLSSVTAMRALVAALVRR